MVFECRHCFPVLPGLNISRQGTHRLEYEVQKLDLKQLKVIAVEFLILI